MVQVNYDLGFPAHEQYAQGQKGLEEFQKQFLRPSDPRMAIVPGQTQIKDVVSKQTHLDSFLQITQKKSWANVTEPADYFSQRMTSIFLVSPIEKLDADLARIESFVKQKTGSTREATEINAEWQTISHMVERVRSINELKYLVQEKMSLLLPG